MPSTYHLLTLTALEVIDKLQSEDVTPSDLVQAQKSRSELVEPHINALVTTCWDRAFQKAAILDKISPTKRGPLCGLPIPIKDLSPVEGVRTTFGSLIFKDNVPTVSDNLVLHLEAQGGVISGKTNTPEFGAGGHTFNEVFGATRNPWNLSMTAGGSSGGAAASLAAGTSWLATGSDYAGSLRTPAAFCGVVGLRPSPFRVPSGPTQNPFENAAVHGPMARNVADTAFFLDMLSWKDPDAPIAISQQQPGFLDAACRPNTKAKIAYSTDLGLGTIQTDIANVVTAAVEGLERSGFPVQYVDLSLRFMDAPYHTFRALDFASGLGEHLEIHRNKLKPEVVWNIEKGLSLTGSEISLAIKARTNAYNKMLALFETNDVLICPASVTKPFNVENRYLGDAEGLGYENYLDWLAITYVLTPLGLPVLAIPCGMTEDGLPVGIQIVGKPQGEAALLSVGAAIEAAIGQWATCEKELDKILNQHQSVQLN